MIILFYRILFFCLISFLMIGCKGLKDLSTKNVKVEKINQQNFKELNGTYSNRQDTVFGGIEHRPYRGVNEYNKTLLDRLFIFYPNETYHDSVIIKLDFISSKKARVQALKNDSIIFSRDIRGKIKRGYFYVRPRILMIPFFPVLYVHNFQRIRIGMVNDGIIIDHTIRMWGFALFAGASENGRSSAIYQNYIE